MADKKLNSPFIGGLIVGFDIGDKYVKIVQSLSGKINRCAIARTPDGLVSDGVILSMDAMADFLRETAKKNRISGKGAYVTIPGALVHTKTVNIPAMTERQLKYNLPFEFRDYLTEDKANYFFDYAVSRITTDEKGTPKEFHLTSCAVLKKTVSEYRSMFRRAGFKLKGAYPAEYVGGLIVRSYVNDGADDKKPDYYCLADIGYTSTKLYIYSKTEHLVKRTVNIGLSGLEAIVSEQLGVDIHVAHSYVVSDFNNVRSAPFAKEFYSSLSAEILKAINFFNYNNREATLSDVYVYGGGYEITQLYDSIKETLNEKTLHPITDLINPKKNVGNMWFTANAVGALIVNSGEISVTVNEEAADDE